MTTDRLVARVRDDVVDIELTVVVDVGACLVVSVELTNTHPDNRYLLDALTITLPLPDDAAELGTFTGRWTRELHPVRVDWPHGAHTAENRRGRTSHEHPPLVFAGSRGYGEWHGEVRGAHLAWSGNHVWLAERLPDGRRYLQLGELFHPGEMAVDPGDSYRTPEVVAVWSDAGLSAATQRFHRRVRARTSHPVRPRPVLVNTWEAVYFDHDQATLRSLADRAAAVGIERFVLDDGWFGSRRDDRRGLGDWTVSPDAHPDGLAPLIDHVTGLGMEFGIWVEPEMVNPDSDLFRTHPDWALTPDGRPPVLGRHQLVLDLTRPEAFEHVLGQLDALLRDHDIDFVKWDMNRDHVAASGGRGQAATHAQTLALYRLLDELRSRHPAVEIESCASGGGRIDHEILRRTERVWTSDCNDALERQTIQRGASMLIPPELMGAHIGPPRAHTTRRRQSLAFRAITAMFGHLGVEWNLLALDERELGAARGDRRAAQAIPAVAAHRRHGALRHRRARRRPRGVRRRSQRGVGQRRPPDDRAEPDERAPVAARSRRGSHLSRRTPGGPDRATVRGARTVAHGACLVDGRHRVHRAPARRGRPAAPGVAPRDRRVAAPPGLSGGCCRCGRVASSLMGTWKPVALLAAGALAVGIGAAGCVSDTPGQQDVARDDDGAVIDGGRVGSQKLRVGDCIEALDGDRLEAVDVVPCDEPHAYEAYHEYVIDGDEYPGSDVIEERAGQRCLAAFEDFIGVPYAESVWEISYFWPTEDTWDNFDDRRVLCLVVRPDDAPTTGTAKDSAE